MPEKVHSNADLSFYDDRCMNYIVVLLYYESRILILIHNEICDNICIFVYYNPNILDNWAVISL